MDLKIVDFEYINIATGKIMKGSDSYLNKKVLLLPDTRIPFGKFRDKKISWIMKNEMQYIYWLKDAGYNIGFDLEYDDDINFNDLNMSSYRIFQQEEKDGAIKYKRTFRKIIK